VSAARDQQAPIAPPEPDLTPAELVERARALRPRVLEEAAETERRRYYSQDLHEEFERAGLYRMWVPRRYGGYEVDVPTFLRVIMEIAHADLGTAWCLCLASGHAMQVATLFDEHAQAELFGDGDFRCPAVAAPTGRATKTDDGWEISGTWPYSSGVPYATHYMGQTLIHDGSGAPPRMLMFVIPRSEWRMNDDWGDLLGLKGSGSHSVTIDRGRIPARFALEDLFMVEADVTGGSPGSRLHGNPMYAGRNVSLFQIELSALMVGAVKGAIDEYEQLVLTRKTQRPPVTLRADDPDYQRWLGVAIGDTSVAEAAVLHAGEEWMEAARRNVEDGVPFTREEDLRLNYVGRFGLRMAWKVMQEQIVGTAGSSAVRDGERMQRIYRDMTMGHGHFGNLLGDSIARQIGQMRLGRLPTEVPAQPA
jgi:3-hydroxy-9,10-secoandrosta-1,3,5(10)-triene-9,17-dione monooxygenase